MATTNTPVATTGAAVTAPLLTTTRRRPSPAEHQRRVAWGHKYGPLAATAIKDAIREAEGR